MGSPGRRGAPGLPVSPRGTHQPDQEMASPSYINDPNHWRDRAEEVRKLAEHMTDPESKRAMVRIAEDYEQLAQRAAKRAGSPSPKSN